MIEIPTQSLGKFFKMPSYCTKIARHIIEQNLSLKFHQNRNFQCMKPSSRGVLSSTRMSQIYWNWWFVYRRLNFQIMASFVSLLKPFMDTREISTSSIKTKPSNIIDFCCLLQVCLGMGETNMITIPTCALHYSNYSPIVQKISFNVTEEYPILENLRFKKPPYRGVLSA